MCAPITVNVPSLMVGQFLVFKFQHVTLKVGIAWAWAPGQTRS